MMRKKFHMNQKLRTGYLHKSSGFHGGCCSNDGLLGFYTI